MDLRFTAVVVARRDVLRLGELPVADRPVLEWIHRARPSGLAASIILSLVACRGAPPTAHEPEPAAPVAAAAPATARATEPTGASLEGRPLEHVVLGSGPRTVLFLASIHGDERSGTPLCEWLVETLERSPELLAGVRAVVVARVNPDGVANGSRTNARGVDLNRNFPAASFAATDRNGCAPLSEPESQHVHELLRRYPPQLVLSFHQAADLIDWDGPAQAWARALAEAAPLDMRRLGTRPGSLGSYVGAELGIPILTVELSRSDLDRTDEELVERYGAMLLRALGPEPVERASPDERRATRRGAPDGWPLPGGERRQGQNVTATALDQPAAVPSGWPGSRNQAW